MIVAFFAAVKLFHHDPVLMIINNGKIFSIPVEYWCFTLVYGVRALSTRVVLFFFFFFFFGVKALSTIVELLFLESERKVLVLYSCF